MIHGLGKNGSAGGASAAERGVGANIGYIGRRVWIGRNPIDVVRIIGTMRNHEDNGRPLTA